MSAFEIQTDSDSFEPGESVSGRVLVHEELRGRALVVRLVYYEETEYALDAFWTGEPVRLHDGAPTAGASFAFSLPIPDDARPPYRSAWGELWWAVRATVDVRHGMDLHERRRILVMPSGVDGAMLAGPGARGSGYARGGSEPA